MANLPESPTWEAGIYQMETTDPVEGGVSGVTNAPLKQLANRTKYLYDNLNGAASDIAALQSDMTTAQGNISDLQSDLNSTNTYASYVLGAATNRRHCVVTAKHSTGAFARLPNFLDASTVGLTSGTMTLTASVTEPFVAVISGGYDPTGPKLYYFMTDTNMTVSYSGSSDLMLLLKRDSGTGVFSLALEPWVTPEYSFTAPSSPPNGKYWYDLRSDRMFKRVSGSWVQTDAIILAKVIPGDELFDYLVHVGNGPQERFGIGQVPPGTVMSFAGGASSVPDGYLLCDGSAISRTTYSYLYGVLGTIYGSGDGTTTFNLPDLRGEFVRGLDNGRGVDSGRTLGSAQAESVNTAGVQLREASTTWASSGVGVGSSQAYFENSSIASYGSNMTLFGGWETRPRNVALNFIIKF